MMIRRHPAKGPPGPDNAPGGELFRVFGGTTFSHFAYHALFDTKSTLGVKVRQTRWQWLRQRPDWYRARQAGTKLLSGIH